MKICDTTDNPSNSKMASTTTTTTTNSVLDSATVTNTLDSSISFSGFYDTEKVKAINKSVMHLSVESEDFGTNFAVHVVRRVRKV